MVLLFIFFNLFFLVCEFSQASISFLRIFLFPRGISIFSHGFTKFLQICLQEAPWWMQMLGFSLVSGSESREVVVGVLSEGRFGSEVNWSMSLFLFLWNFLFREIYSIVFLFGALAFPALISLSEYIGQQGVKFCPNKFISQVTVLLILKSITCKQSFWLFRRSLK
jgi:hypothetical protein